MNKAGVISLTATERYCLRRVHLNYSSKNIARELGSSPHTIDNHIKAAMRRLGVSSRFEAARIFAEHDDPDADRRTLTSQSSALPEPMPNRATTELPSAEDPLGEGLLERSGVAAVAYSAHQTEPWSRKLLPTPRFWGDKNRLSSAQRLVRIIWLTALVGLAVGGVMASLRALSELI